MQILKVAAIAGFITLGGASLAIAQPGADPSAPPNQAIKPQGQMASMPLAKGHNSFTKGQAMKRIQKAGYTDVAMLDLDADGLWQATAMQNGQSLHVALDYKGDIAAQ